MKYILILFGLIFITVSKSNSQNLNFGFLGGYNSVNFHVTDWYRDALGKPYRPMNSYNLNCFISYKSKGIVGVSIEPGIIQKGGSNGLNNRCRWELNYFQLPFMADVYVFRKLSLSLGPEFAYRLWGRVIELDRTGDLPSLWKNKFELSGLVGVNYMITKKIKIGLRYNHALTYVAKLPIYGQQREILRYSEQYTQYLQFNVSYRIFQNSFELANL